MKALRLLCPAMARCFAALCFRLPVLALGRFPSALALALASFGAVRLHISLSGSEAAGILTLQAALACWAVAWG